MSLAVCASIGPIGRSGVSRKRARPSAPSPDAPPRLKKIASEHRRAAHVGGRYVRCPRDCVGHHPLERSLPELSEKQTAEKLLLRLGGTYEERLERRPPGSLRPGPEID